MVNDKLLKEKCYSAMFWRLSRVWVKLTLCVSEAVTTSCQGGNKTAKGRELEFYATEMEAVFILIVFL